MTLQIQKILPTILLWSLVTTLFAQDPTPAQEKKAAVTKKVYDKVVKAIGDARQAPVFVFAHNKTEQENYTTYFNPKRNSIIVGEGIYNIATSFGADSLNALAFVVGHELAHYYKGHGWGMAFGSSAEDLEIAKEIYDSELSIERKKIMEAEADYFGGLYGYLAGYSTLDVGGNFINAFYEIGFPDEVPGYPTKEDRKKIVAEVGTDLVQLLHVFEAAKLLSITGHHEESGRCYHHIATKFPSREIYNNEGVNLATQALTLFNKDEVKFYYPFGLDEDSRLYGNTKGDDPIEKRVALLKEAVTAFELATHLDKNYAPGYINAALAYNLLNDPEMAKLMLMKGTRLVEQQKDTALLANASIALGIISAKTNLKKVAKVSFETAKKGNQKVAELNLKVLNTSKHYSEFINKKEKNELVKDEKESINEMDPSLFEVLLDDANMIQLKSQDKKRAKIKIYNYNQDGVVAMHVKHYTKPTLQLTYVSTPEKYEGRTSRGISLGDNIEEVLKSYGTPSSVKSSTKGNYYIYEKTGILFQTKGNEKVLKWVLF